MFHTFNSTCESILNIISFFTFVFYNCLQLTIFVCYSWVFRPNEMVEYIYFHCFSYGFSIKKYVSKELVRNKTND